MIKKLIFKLHDWYVKKGQKYKKEQAKTKELEHRRKLYTQLRQLYQFVKWLNTKGLGNRHQRKVFWRDVQNNQPLMEDLLQKLIKKYKSETPQDLECGDRNCKYKYNKKREKYFFHKYRSEK